MTSLAISVAAGKKGGSSPKHKWTEEERGIVRRDYDGTRLGTDLLAVRLHVTRYAVKGQAGRLGIMMQKSPDWTEKELMTLRNLVHRYAVSEIAKKLHRTQNSVRLKATRLKLGLRMRDDWFTKNEVCEILGVDHHKVQTWIDCGALRARWHSAGKPQKHGMFMWHVEADDLKCFIIRCSGELLGRNVDIQQIVWLLTGDMAIYKNSIHPDQRE